MEAPQTIALITGANRGIGLEIARGLGRRPGTAVLVAARDAAAAEESARVLQGEGLQAHGIHLDVTDAGTIGRASRTIGLRFDRLDVLVNNAGIALDYAPPSLLSMDVVRQTYETNVFGAIATTQILLPLLRKSNAPRIVNVSSGLGSLTRQTSPDNPFAHYLSVAYSTSKTALNAVTVAFARELAGEGFKINAADPGHTATNLNQFTGPRTPEQGAAIIIELATLANDGPTAGYFNEDGALPW
jgi:NAD(P)-dependent dehydrogenase (short-subunit alcohol dehydrogenase family)